MRDYLLNVRNILEAMDKFAHNVNLFVVAKPAVYKQIVVPTLIWVSNVGFR